jgi:selenocysteine-specific elongation factor
MRIIGTAGHVDHGKSALVISLTGHNPDRWAQERERGMTLDLGFAPLRYADGTEAGIIDVPGHARFLHNMLAGAAGMDLLLLVIDAVEGPRPQTREHLHILNFLNVRRAIVVLTKADLVDAEAIEIASALARDVCIGTVAWGAPILSVSNVTSAGIEELKATIHDVLTELPPHRTDAPAYLPIDRVFALPGHGTIVTGTLMQGALSVGAAVELQPSGISARVRSLQIFGRKVDSATAGSRVAVNLPGIDVASIARGEVLAAPRAFEPAATIDIRFTALAEALPLLKRRTPVRAHIGSAEIPGRLAFEAGVPTAVQPVAARLILSRPTVFYPGSRLILRRMSPKDLLGGAVAVGVADRTGARDDLDATAQPSEGNPCLQSLAASALTPMSLHRIAAAANILESTAESELAQLVEDGRAAVLQKPLEYLSRAAFDAAWERVAETLRERHAAIPWRLGCSVSELASAIGASDALTVRLIAAWQDDGRVAQRARFWHLPEFTPTLTREQRAFFDKALAPVPDSPLAPASYDAIARAADSAKIAGLREAVDSLVALGALTRIGDDVYRRSQLERAEELLLDVMRKNPAGATMAQLRDAFGTSRKFALPLMERFDSLGLTIRDGDLRRLRSSRP